MTMISIDVDIQDLVDGISIHGSSESDIIELIRGIDLRIADTDFTEKLITELVESLKSDLSPEEMNHFLRKLAV